MFLRDQYWVRCYSTISLFIESYRIHSHHLYADEIQAYISITLDTARSAIPNFLSSVMNLMTQNRLKRNAETDLILMGTNLHASSLSAKMSPSDPKYSL